MLGLVKTAIKQRKITIFLAVMIGIYGFYAYYYLPKQENPTIAVPVCLLTTIYPGASPEDIKSLVSKKIEDKVVNVKGTERIVSLSSNSVSIVVLWLDKETEPEDAWQELRRKINEVQDDLPEGSWETEINTKLAETAGIIISLSGEQYTYEQLEAFAEQFKDELNKVVGVSRFEIVGKVEKQVDVEINTAQLNRSSFSLVDMNRLFQAQNTQIPTGALESKTGKITLNTPGIFESLKDIQNTIIDVSPETGDVVRIKDIASVRMGLERDSIKITQNGQNAVLLVGYFQDSKNVILVGREVREKLDKVKQKLPSDLQVDEILFQPENVNRSVSIFMSNVLQGILFVIIVVFIGMGLRNAIIVSFAIPLSVLTTFVVMDIFGIKIHQTSTTALVISLGMLVDNAIVISDAIQVRLDDGMERAKAAFDGVRESALPVFTSTLTTVAAFSPLLGLKSEAGDFIRSIPQVVIISLMASFVVAMLVTPAMACMFFKATPKKERKNFLRRGFEFLLGFGLKQRAITLLIVFSVFAVSMYCTRFLSPQFFPFADTNVMYLDVVSEVYNLESTEALAKRVEDMLTAQPEVTEYTTAIGAGLPKFYMTVPVRTKALDFAQIRFKVDLEEGGRFKNKSEFSAHLQNLFDKKITNGKVTVKRLETTAPKMAKVHLRLSGGTMNRLREVSKEIQALMEEIPGTINIKDDASSASFEYVVDTDDDIATMMGITKYDLQAQIHLAMGGSHASVFRRAGKEYNIVQKSDITTSEELLNLGIKSSITGNKVLLKQIAEIRVGSRIDVIKRYNRELSISVMSDVLPGYSAVEIEDILEREVLPKIDSEGVSLDFDGERESIKRNFGDIGIAALFALLAIFIILMLQFKSFAQPFVVLITVPLSVTGSIFGLLIFGMPLSFTAFLGVASLIGIVVNNAILLIEFINKSTEGGMSIDGACREAMEKRFRPILLSTTTTIVGLMPLAVSGSDMFGPMSVALMSGLIVSTLFTLIVIPVVFNVIIKLISGERRQEG